MGRFLFLPIFFERFAPVESVVLSGFSLGAPRGRDFKDEEAMSRPLRSFLFNAPLLAPSFYNALFTSEALPLQSPYAQFVFVFVYF